MVKSEETTIEQRERTSKSAIENRQSKIETPPRLSASAGEKYQYRNSRGAAEAQRIKMVIGFTRKREGIPFGCFQQPTTNNQ